jgi:prefoldin alpha subunit
MSATASNTTAAGNTAAVATVDREINPMQLSLEQLNGLKSQHEEDLQELQRQLESLVGARNRFNIAKSTITDIATYPENQKLLVPLNSSLYVPGKVTNPNKVCF